MSRNFPMMVSKCSVSIKRTNYPNPFLSSNSSISGSLPSWCNIVATFQVRRLVHFGVRVRVTLVNHKRICWEVVRMQAGTCSFNMLHITTLTVKQQNPDSPKSDQKALVPANFRNFDEFPSNFDNSWINPLRPSNSRPWHLSDQLIPTNKVLNLLDFGKMSVNYWISVNRQ